MRSFFFGDASRQRLAVYHEAARETADHAVVMCAPIAQEYVRTHWALRKLAVDLSRAGLPVLRFDYTGTGDSAGDLSDASLATWTQDVCDAVAEVRDASGATRVSLVGLRFGASLASSAVAEKLKVRDLVLWDPVISGETYLASLRGMHQRMLVDPNRFPKPLLDRFRKGQARVFPNQPDELLGFHFPQALARDIQTVDLVRHPPMRARRVLVVTSHEDPDMKPLSNALKEADVPHQTRLQPDAGDWNEEARIEDALICQTIPASILSFLMRPTETDVAQCAIGGDPP